MILPAAVPPYTLPSIAATPEPNQSQPLGPPSHRSPAAATATVQLTRVASRHGRGLHHFGTPQLAEKRAVGLEEVELAGEGPDGEVKWLGWAVCPGRLEFSHVAADHVVVNDGVVWQESSLGRVGLGLGWVYVPEVQLLVIRGADEFGPREVEPLQAGGKKGLSGSCAG